MTYFRLRYIDYNKKKNNGSIKESLDLNVLTKLYIVVERMLIAKYIIFCIWLFIVLMWDFGIGILWDFAWF